MAGVVNGRGRRSIAEEGRERWWTRCRWLVGGADGAVSVGGLVLGSSLGAVGWAGDNSAAETQQWRRWCCCDGEAEGKGTRKRKSQRQRRDWRAVAEPARRVRWTGEQLAGRDGEVGEEGVTVRTEDSDLRCEMRNRSVGRGSVEGRGSPWGILGAALTERRRRIGASAIGRYQWARQQWHGWHWGAVGGGRVAGEGC